MKVKLEYVIRALLEIYRPPPLFVASQLINVILFAVKSTLVQRPPP